MADPFLALNPDARLGNVVCGEGEPDIVLDTRRQGKQHKLSPCLCGGEYWRISPADGRQRGQWLRMLRPVYGNIPQDIR